MKTFKVFFDDFLGESDENDFLTLEEIKNDIFNKLETSSEDEIDQIGSDLLVYFYDYSYEELEDSFISKELVYEIINDLEEEDEENFYDIHYVIFNDWNKEDGDDGEYDYFGFEDDEDGELDEKHKSMRVKLNKARKYMKKTQRQVRIEKLTKQPEKRKLSLVNKRKHIRNKISDNRYSKNYHMATSTGKHKKKIRRGAKKKR